MKKRLTIGSFRLVICMSWVLTLLTITPAGYAQSNAVWGMVDTRLVLILHPGMAEFDFTRGRFFRISPAKTTKQALQEALNKGIVGIQPKLADLRLRQSEIVAARTTHLLALDAELTEIRAQRPKGAASGVLELSLKKEHDLQNRLTQGLATIDAQLAVVDAQIANLWEKTGDELYLTAAESGERMNRILREIGEHVVAVSRETGVPFVVDVGWGMRSLRKAEDMISIPVQNDAVNLLDTMVFHLFTNWSGPRERLQSPQQEKAWSLFAAGLDDKGQETVKRVVKRNPHISTGLAAFTPGRTLLRGGYDLTPAIARRLFSAYAIPEQLKNSYMTLLKDVGTTDLRPR